MGDYIDNKHASILEADTALELRPARRTVPASKWGVAAQCTTDEFKIRENSHKPLAKDWTYRLTGESTTRTGSSLKAAFKHLQNPDVISLGGGIPLSEFLPFEALSFTPSFVPKNSKSAPNSSLDDGPLQSSKTDLADGRSVFDISVALNYGQGSGSPQLLRWIIEHTEIVHNPPYADWGCTMTVGNTSALDMALRMLAKPGDYVLSEKFTYSTAVETAKPMGVKFFGVDMDGEGLLPESLLDVLDSWNPAEHDGAAKPFLLYLVPTGHNPTGATQSLERRRNIYRVAQKHDLIILEDDPYYWLQMDPYNSCTENEPSSTPLSPADLLKMTVPTYLKIDVDGRVMRMDSFSKVVSPGSRIGWITAPQAVIERYKTHADVSTQGPSGFSQLALFKLLDEFWGHAGYLEWLLHIRKEYTERRDFMVRACERHLPRDIVTWEPARAGMFQWLGVDWHKHPDASTKSPSEIEEEIWQEALAQGALIARGSWFNANKHVPLKEVFCRTTFAAAPLNQIEEADTVSKSSRVSQYDRERVQLDDAPIPSRLSDLPLECLQHIFELVVEYEEDSEYNLRDAARLLRVSKMFEVEIMRAINTTRLLRKMRRNSEVDFLAQRGHTHRISSHCRLQHRGDASFFLAKCLINQPYHHLPWNTNLSTAINAITDRTMSDDGLDPEGEERFRRVHQLCQQAVHLPLPVKHYGIWHLFCDDFQSLLFPENSVITEEPFEDLTFLAQVYLHSTDAERLLLSRILEKGPKSLSIIGATKPQDQGQFGLPPLMGSVMEAAIRTENSNLVATLINYGINTSRRKVTTKVKGKKAKGCEFYHQHFWRLAVAFGDLESLSAFLEIADRRIPSNTLRKILLEAVCTQQPEALKLLMDNQLPWYEQPETIRFYRSDRVNKVLDICLEEAVKHGHPGVFGALISTPYAKATAFYIRSWRMSWGFGHWVQSTSDHCRPARSLIELAASRGDEETIREMLSKGASPYGLTNNAKPHHRLNPYHRLSHLRGLMPMIAAAKNRHVGAVLALIRGHFKCNEVRWLLIIGTVLKSRDKEHLHRQPLNSNPPVTSKIEADNGERRIQRDRDVKFWQELIDAGVLDLQHSAKGCQCSETLMAMAATHPTRIAIETARMFVCEQLVVPFDAENRGCGDQSHMGPDAQQFTEKIRPETGHLFTL
ncbi:aromatic amino acid aminotransferase [Colletotrichum orchidophilum]|uniref:aromatic-amino-acid transaminase n=1 Tax=Colletotrichum orchidophilum TaxID=1209926 RepID=A0A1G4AVD4_9PEZI|nr:aromatic amino acid aminotransferase [Colletotrichum orchidophilum]OHE93139.1 aromatic amino acid aminotransferase [Colletotrichum orchidophilum]